MEIDSENKIPFPPESYHVRRTEKIVNDSYYETISALQGMGLSISKAMEAFITVANVFFHRQFKQPGAYEDIFDVDTLPHERNSRKAVKLEEVKVCCIMDNPLDLCKLETKLSNPKWH